jgi:feruloyl esterase
MSRMRRALPTSLLVIGLASAAHSQVAPAARGETRPTMSCASLAALKLDNTAITGAIPVPADSRDVSHCRVLGRIDKEINFTALLPDRWNGAFFGGGAGGFAGTSENQAQASLNLGFATAGTDTGHQGDGLDASWALNNAERQTNFGHRAIHRMTETAKAIVRTYYGRPPAHSYFYGCSNGGRQALMEAQRYPDDYDGIVSCAPALDITNITASFIRNTQLAFPDRQSTESVLTPEVLTLLESKVLDACDAADGAKDGLLSDPPSCRFDLATLPACPDDRRAASCVTSGQRAAMAGIYSPTMSGRSVIYPGQPFGLERGWQGWMTNAGPSPSLQSAFGTQFFKYFVFGKADWDYRAYDLSRWLQDTRTIAREVDAANPDLSAFKARRGKLILWHGWADPAINPLRTIEYYDRIVARDSQAATFVRLFMLPGVLHGVGGIGPDNVDWMTAIVDWVERGRAPDSLIATKAAEHGRPAMSRPLCPYPQRAVYAGKGNINDAGSYRCR